LTYFKIFIKSHLAKICGGIIYIIHVVISTALQQRAGNSGQLAFVTTTLIFVKQQFT